MKMMISLFFSISKMHVVVVWIWTLSKMKPSEKNIQPKSDSQLFLRLWLIWNYRKKIWITLTLFLKLWLIWNYRKKIFYRKGKILEKKFFPNLDLVFLFLICLYSTSVMMSSILVSVASVSLYRSIKSVSLVFMQILTKSRSKCSIEEMATKSVSPVFILHNWRNGDKNFLYFGNRWYVEYNYNINIKKISLWKSFIFFEIGSTSTSLFLCFF